MTAPEKIFVLPAYNDGKSSAPMTVCGPDFAHSATQYVRADLAQAAIAAAMMGVMDCRKWYYYPIEMPIAACGNGPATLGEDAVKMTYEVWDRCYATVASFDNLPDAINESLRLSIPTDTMAALDAVKAQVRDEALESAAKWCNAKLAEAKANRDEAKALGAPIEMQRAWLAVISHLEDAPDAIRAMKGRDQ